MITKNKDIVIVVACNSHYLIMLAVLLKSIEMNHQSDEHIQLWIIEENISKKNKKRLENSLSKEVFSITWISSKMAIPKGMTLPLDKNTYPLNIFMRL
ncbi:glycosyltransferase family 8 protein, partial [Pseudoxanthomonas sp. SGD-10]